MLLVNARAGTSRIHGIGLIARENIPAGALIWRFDPEFDVEIPEERLDRLSPPSREQVRHYAYYDGEAKRYRLSSDDDRFTNHSEAPNTQLRRDGTRAAREIVAGEEITVNYRDFGMPAPTL